MNENADNQGAGIDEVDTGVDEWADGFPGELSGKDAVIAEVLAMGRTQQAAADAAGCSLRTVARRMESKTFRGFVRHLETGQLQQVDRQRRSDAAEAFDLMLHEMRTARTSGDRRAAANLVMRFGLGTPTSLGQRDLLARVEELGACLGDALRLVSEQRQRVDQVEAELARVRGES